MADDAANDVNPRFIYDIKKVELGEQLGEGGSGSVHKAVLLDTNETVAMKKVFTDDDKNKVGLCRSLCKKLITLHSDYIVRFIGMSEDPKHFYFITELATGGSLMQALQSHPMRDDLATLLRWALDIVSGLAYLHSRQPHVLHLDIKPQNVLLFGCGLAKLCDFDTSQVTEHTQTAAREGATYRYAAPEQLLKGGKVSAATDIYGLGGVLYVMALKKEPWFDIRKPLEIVHKHIAGEGVPIPSPLPPDCHASIMAIAQECLRHNPQDRPTLEQAQQKLRSLLRDAEGATPNAHVLDRIANYVISPAGDSMVELRTALNAFAVVSAWMLQTEDVLVRLPSKGRALNLAFSEIELVYAFNEGALNTVELLRWAKKLLGAVMNCAPEPSLEWLETIIGSVPQSLLTESLRSEMILRYLATPNGARSIQLDLQAICLEKQSAQTIFALMSIALSADW